MGNDLLELTAKTGSMTKKKKMGELNFIEIKNFCPVKETVKEENKDKPQTENL